MALSALILIHALLATGIEGRTQFALGGRQIEVVIGGLALEASLVIGALQTARQYLPTEEAQSSIHQILIGHTPEALLLQPTLLTMREDIPTWPAVIFVRVENMHSTFSTPAEVKTLHTVGDHVPALITTLVVVLLEP